jgi:hypothetical protein
MPFTYPRYRRIWWTPRGIFHQQRAKTPLRLPSCGTPFQRAAANDLFTPSGSSVPMSSITALGG